MNRCFISILFAISIISCNTNSNKIGEYVYLSENDVIHIDKDCPQISNIIFINTIDGPLDLKCCKYCIDNTAYNELKRISKNAFIKNVMSVLFI